MKLGVFFCVLFISMGVLSQKALCAQTANETPPHKRRCILQREEIEIFASYLKQGKTYPQVLVTKTVPTEVDVEAFNLQLAVKGRGIPPEVRADFKEKNKSTCGIEPFAGIKNLYFISKGFITAGRVLSITKST